LNEDPTAYQAISRAMLKVDDTTPPIHIALGTILLMLSLWFAFCHATQPSIVSFAAISLALLSWKFPRFWLLSTPMALIAGDFYLDTGQLLPQEREVMILALVGGRLFDRSCEYWLPTSSYLHWLPFIALLIFAGIRGFFVLPDALSGDELSTYASNHNPLRILLAYSVGALLFPLAFQAFDGTCETRNLNWTSFLRGMQIAASWVCLTSIYERAVSVGLLDLDFVLRATGPFNSMHIGGHHIDAYWALAIPFVFRFETKRSIRTFVLWTLQIIAVYAIFATMSRAIIVFALASIVVLALLRTFLFSRDSRGFEGSAPTEAKLPRVGILALIIAFGLILWSAGSAVPGRFGRFEIGLETRKQHLQDVTELAAEKLLMGYGIGTYSSVFRASIDRPQTAVGLTESENGIAVRMYSGEQAFLEQTLDTRRPLPWTIKIKCAGSNKPGILICHKSLLQSFDCIQPEKTGSNTSHEYLLRELPDDLLENDMSPRMRRFCRVTIGLHPPTSKSGYLDIDEVSIVDSDGKQVIKNGDFSEGSKHWFFSTDDHLVYHATNLWSHMAIEIGMLGVLAMAVPILLLSKRLRRLAKRERNDYSLTLMSSFVGFLAIGLFGTMLNTSWTIELVCLLVAVGEGLTHQKES